MAVTLIIKLDINNNKQNNNKQHLIRVYYVPGTVLNNSYLIINLEVI